MCASAHIWPIGCGAPSRRRREKNCARRFLIQLSIARRWRRSRPSGARADLDIVRYWGLAATEKTELSDPNWTVGIKLGRDKNRGYWLLDIVRGRANPGDVERLLLDTATRDGRRVRVRFGKDPGQAGKSQALHLVRALSGFDVTSAGESGNKVTRFRPFSAQCRGGNVKILRAPWNED